MFKDPFIAPHKSQTPRAIPATPELIALSDHTIDESLLPEAPAVLDVGSRAYGFANALLALRPLARVWCVEPDPAAKDPVDERIVLIRKAVTGVALDTAPYRGFSTGEGNYLTINPRYAPVPGPTVEVPCTTIQVLTEEAGVGMWDLVKLDCEGSEFSILEHWPEPPPAVQITVEFHDYGDLDFYTDAFYAALFDRLRDYAVRKHGLTPAGPGYMGHWDSLLIKKGE